MAINPKFVRFSDDFISWKNLQNSTCSASSTVDTCWYNQNKDPRVLYVKTVDEEAIF